MSGKYDTEQIRQANSLSSIVAKSVDLKPDGAEFRACCPFHKEKTPSFTVSDSKGFYFCFGCGSSGDVIDFVMQYHKVSFRDACDILGGEKEAPDSKPTQKPEKEELSIYDNISILGNSSELLIAGAWLQVWNPKRNRWTKYQPSAVYPYYQQGMENPWFYVIRIEMPDNKKITPVVAYCQFEDGSRGWSHIPAPANRPLYGTIKPKGQVLIVEGEKSRDAAHIMLKDTLSSVTWCGGGKAIKKTDWSVLAGRSVVIWPDADEPGVQTANQLADILSTQKCTVKIIQVPTDKNGWDAADALKEGWNKDKFLAWAKENAKPVYSNEPPPAPEQKPEQKEKKATKNKQDVSDKPYKILGFNNGNYYYLPKGTEQIISLSAPQHAQGCLLGLAPFLYWNENFGDGKKIDWQVVADALIRASERKGIFDPHKSLRGRGAWRDEGRTIMHLGTHCYVDGENMKPSEIESRFIYQAQSDVGIKLGKPLSTQEAHKLFEFCNKLSWENRLSGALLAGWCVVAPLSGVLKWRPHIWITGPSGSGKSTVTYDIIGAVLGEAAIHMEGVATEAGIRQKLNQDARPVVFDEAESEESRDAIRMQEVLNLARISSSGGNVIKGGKDGKSQSFSVRSCFCFSSINTGVKHFADETRISKLVLKIDRRPESGDFYDNLEKEIIETLNPEFSSGLLSRSLQNMDALEGNISSFRRAATKVFKSRRIADQIGTLLAGTYLLHSTESISAEKAEEFIRSKDWSEHTTINEKSDPERLLDKICTHRMVVNTKHQTCKPSIGELILKASMGELYILDGISEDIAQKELSRYGIKIDHDKNPIISNNADPIKNILKDTPWHSNWSRPLGEIQGSTTSENTYFAPGIKSRGKKIPLALFSG